VVPFFFVVVDDAGALNPGRTVVRNRLPERGEGKRGPGERDERAVEADRWIGAESVS
jgi:hypothetical protein